jgi:hypothetical protein
MNVFAPTTINVRCNAETHHINITRDGQIELANHTLATLKAFTAFGARVPRCLEVYEHLAPIVARVTTHALSSKEQRPFETLREGTSRYKAMMRQPYVQAMGPAERFRFFEEQLMHLNAVLFYYRGRILPEEFYARLTAVAEKMAVPAFHAMNCYKMPRGKFSAEVEFGAYFSFTCDKNSIDGAGKEAMQYVPLQRGDVDRVIALTTSFSEYSDVLERFDEGVGPAGTFALSKMAGSRRAAIAAMREWVHRGHVVVVAGRPLRGFTVEGQDALIGWDVRREDWVLKRWL